MSGHYTNYQICPTCGLASADALIGEVDDPRYFEHPDRYNADILWFTRGYVEYAIPNFIPASKKSHRSQFPQNLVPKHQAPTMTGLPISVLLK